MNDAKEVLCLRVVGCGCEYFAIDRFRRYSVAALMQRKRLPHARIDRWRRGGIGGRVPAERTVAVLVTLAAAARARIIAAGGAGGGGVGHRGREQCLGLGVRRRLIED